ncbi:MAG TPA: DUF4347 domain-containing protein, partial [Hyphomicrobiaceae bacterium]|nr:DUF4347 domain-containing protein [Hyphomicrobiaceae bacterium]
MAKSTTKAEIQSATNLSHEMRNLLHRLKLAGSYRVLEQRMVFDGASVETAGQLAHNEPAAIAPGGSDEAGAQLDAIDALDVVAAMAATPIGLEAQGSSIVFIDHGVGNADELISAVPPGSEIVFLDPSTDGVEQIAEYLSGRHDIESIHILSHGSQGELALGNATLTSETMQGEHLDDLTVIGSALTPDGDILIYGCNFSDGESGLKAAIILGGITGADIAASDNLTGHVDLGGDWHFETEVGEIDALGLEAPDWMGLLDPPVDFDFSMISTLESGVDLQVGAVYRFSGVSPGFDALVEISDMQNATLAQLDDSSQGVDRAFQPEIVGNAAGSYVEFRIQFVAAG